MAISVECGLLMPLGRVPRLVEKISGIRPHISTIHRWKNQGIEGVRLETVSIGSRCFTTEKAVYDFFEKSSAIKRRDKSAIEAIEESKRQQTLSRLEDEARKLGI
jgi:hypothetical protein